MKKCMYCGQDIIGGKFCRNCGAPVEYDDPVIEEVPKEEWKTEDNDSTQNNNTYQSNQSNDYGVQQKSRTVAGILGIFLGAWGVHNFYLGFISKGVIQIVVTIVTCGIGGLWGFIEGIVILCGGIDRDANGVPLKE